MWAQPGTQLPAGPHFEAELEINDFPQHARWKVRALRPSAALCLRRSSACLRGVLSDEK